MAGAGTSLADLKIDRSEPGPVNPWPLVVALVLLGGVVAGGWWWYTRPRPAEVRVLTLASTTPAESGRRVLLNASGYVVARRQATVSSKVTGKVVEVMAEEGKRVTADQVLARLDDTNAQIELRLATAQLQAVRSAVKEVEVRIEEAEKEHVRAGELGERGLGPRWDSVRTEAELRALRARLDRQRLEIAVAERQEEQVRQQLEDLLIRAPFTGVVTTKSAQPGEMISPVSAGGGFTRTGICTIVDMDSLEIEVDVSESYINRVQPGQPVDAVLDAYPDWKVPARVLAIIPAADRQRATVKVRICFEQIEPRILPEMGVKVAFQGEMIRSTPAAVESAPVLRVPRTAVREVDGRSSVFVVQADRVEGRAIKVEDTGGSDLTVVAGLRAGERIVTDGPASLRDGDRVRETRD